jgi:hypothetical protein
MVPEEATTHPQYSLVQSWLELLHLLSLSNLFLQGKSLEAPYALGSLWMKAELRR